MSKPRINVHNNETWGRLVKTWATGKNYVDHKITEADPVPTTVENPPTYPKPTSFKDFATQAIKAKVGLHFKDGPADKPVTGDEDMGFLLVQVTSDTAVLRLPAPEKIAESEQQLLAAGGQYPLPPFYRRIYGNDPEDQDTKEKKMILHAERVGEYTINTCV